MKQFNFMKKIININSSRIFICNWQTTTKEAEVLMVTYIASPPKGHTQYFVRLPLGFDYGMHLLWHFFLLLQCHKIFIVSVHSIFTKILYWWEMDNHAKPSPVQPSSGLRSGLCGGQSMCDNDVSCSLNHNFSPLHPGMEYVHAIKGKKSINGITWSSSIFR